MKVVAWLSGDAYAGSSVTARAMVRELVRLGDDVVDEEHWPEADVVLAHAEHVPELVSAARRHRTPIALLVRDPLELRYIDARHVGVAVFPSEALRRQTGWFATRSIAVRPPIWVSQYRLDARQMFSLDGDAGAITLVNGTASRGAHLFFELARRCPHRRFLLVRGAGRQVPPPPLRNLEVVGPFRDMRDAYEQTRVLLMPSAQTYGRPAVEAACSGIPTIAHRCEASVQTLGERGAVWANRERVHEWLAAFTRLDDPKAYALAAAAAFSRAVQLDPTGDVVRLQRGLRETLKGYRDPRYWTGHRRD